MEDAGKRRRWRILWRIVATIERENDHVRRNARRKAQWSCLLSSLSVGRDLPRKRKLQSNKEVYCYPTACICDRTFSLRSWAECVSPSSRVSMCFPFAFTLVFRVPAAWLVLPFLLVDVFGIVQPMKSYEGKISSALRPFERHAYTDLNESRFSIKNMTPSRRHICASVIR